MNGEIAAVGFDSQIDALGHIERRWLLRALLETDSDEEPRVGIGRSDPGTSTGELEVSMYHVHLPKLEEVGLVSADRTGGRVGRGPNFEDIEPLLELLEEHREELPADWL